MVKSDCQDARAAKGPFLLPKGARGQRHAGSLSCSKRHNADVDVETSVAKTIGFHWIWTRHRCFSWPWDVISVIDQPNSTWINMGYVLSTNSMEFSNVFSTQKKTAPFPCHRCQRSGRYPITCCIWPMPGLIRTWNNTRLRLEMENTPHIWPWKYWVNEVRKPVDGYGFCSPLSTKFWWSSRDLSGPLDRKPMW